VQATHSVLGADYVNPETHKIQEFILALVQVAQLAVHGVQTLFERKRFAGQLVQTVEELH